MHNAPAAMRLNVHLHVLALDGVYVRENRDGALVFHPLPAPTSADVTEVVADASRRPHPVIGRRAQGAGVRARRENRAEFSEMFEGWFTTAKPTTPSTSSTEAISPTEWYQGAAAASCVRAASRYVDPFWETYKRRSVPENSGRYTRTARVPSNVSQSQAATPHCNG